MSMQQYLGDGVFADFDGYSIILTAEDGQKVLHMIVLEPAVWLALQRYADRLIAAVDATARTSAPTPE